MKSAGKREIPWSECTPVVKSAAVSSAPPNYVIPRRWFTERIRDFDLWLVCDGRVALEHPSGKISALTRGSAVLLRPGDCFELRVDESGPYTNAYIHFDFVDDLGRVISPDRMEIPATVGHIHDIPYFETTIRRIMFLQYQMRQVGEELQTSIRQLASHFLKGLLRDYELSEKFAASSQSKGLQQRHTQMVNSALSWIYQHPDTTLTASELAVKFGCSQRHFGRIFRQVSGKTPGQALIEAKIDHAKKLLAGSSLNVSEIAASLNYESVFYFSRQFRRSVGLSPQAFRRQL